MLGLLLDASQHTDWPTAIMAIAFLAFLAVIIIFGRF